MKKRGAATLGDWERLERYAAGALGSTRLEGLEPTHFARECVRRVRVGEITREEAIAELKALYQR